jgi:hypothetical protein
MKSEDTEEKNIKGEKNGASSVMEELTQRVTPSSSFDPSRLRLSQDFQETLGVKQALLSVPVRKPDKQWFIRTHRDETYRLPVAVIELKEERETYIVHPSICSELTEEIVPKTLITSINRAGVVFLWPVRLPGRDGRHDEWSRTSLSAADMAKDRWVRVAADMSLGAYRVYQASDDLPEPEWPDIDFEKLLEVAFQGRLIQTLDHDVIRRLRGQM